ncbi:unnamed protein product [Mytilus edulis]|uniref:C1q domain-containing protein n=1 Tax=Mytilus edulis TaxID=6550 RepID=A0A8S3T236_MYTED|nr:unnamed protein product [Mytilus edulis]
MAGILYYCLTTISLFCNIVLGNDFDASAGNDTAIHNFSCFTYDWEEYVLCSWDYNTNLYSSNVTVKWHFLGSSVRNDCPDLGNKSCKWIIDKDIDMDRKYNVCIEIYQSNKPHCVLVDIQSLVKPSPIVKFDVRAVNSTSATVQWPNNRIYYNKSFQVHIMRSGNLAARQCSGFQFNQNTKFRKVPSTPPLIYDGYNSVRTNMSSSERTITVYWMVYLNNQFYMILSYVCLSKCLSKNMDDNDRGEILALKRKVEMMSNMYAEVMRSKTKIDELEQKVQECPCSATHKRLLIPNTNPSLNIAFDAIISGNRDYVGHADVTIIFDTVMTNRGDAYQKDIGLFIAPVSGTYLFTWTIRGDAGSSFVSGLFVNGIRKVGLHTDGSSQSILRPVATKTAILDLNVNDHVFIKAIGIHIRGLLLSDINGHSSFAGFLLFTN